MHKDVNLSLLESKSPTIKSNVQNINKYVNWLKEIDEAAVAAAAVAAAARVHTIKFRWLRHQVCCAFSFIRSKASNNDVTFAAHCARKYLYE